MGKKNDKKKEVKKEKIDENVKKPVKNLVNIDEIENGFIVDDMISTKKYFAKDVDEITKALIVIFEKNKISE